MLGVFLRMCVNYHRLYRAVAFEEPWNAVPMASAPSNRFPVTGRRHHNSSATEAKSLLVFC